MDSYITGTVIKKLREKHGLTQSALAEKLTVSHKTVSKWETGRGYPDISLLEPIAKAFGISLAELMSGKAISNENVAANMLRSKFYVCPVCGNIFHSMGEAVIHCHGLQLPPLETEEADEGHQPFLERIENTYYVRIAHTMTKTHYISFAAALSMDRIQMVRLYPEGEAAARFSMDGVKRILFYCNQGGLYHLDIPRSLRRGETVCYSEKRTKG